MERVKEWLLDVLYPEGNACHLCGRGLEEDGILCHDCRCSLLVSRFKPDRIAAGERHGHITQCLSAFPHVGEARKLVHFLKYESDTAAASLLGETMAYAFVEFGASSGDFDFVMPVPLHSSRLEERGYNQALLLAKAVAFHLSLPVMHGNLLRIRPTETQLDRDRTARLEAMRSAFCVRAPLAVHEKRILLVDDVLTTGATAMSCARVLTEADAANVTLLTVCRVEKH